MAEKYYDYVKLTPKNAKQLVRYLKSCKSVRVVKLTAEGIVARIGEDAWTMSWKWNESALIPMKWKRV